VRLESRLRKLEQAAPDDKLYLIVAVPVAEAGGRPPGLYATREGERPHVWVHEGDSPYPLPAAATEGCKIVSGFNPWLM
jgi:hypothetical protein